MDTHFDPLHEMALLKAQTHLIRKRNYRQRISRLDTYHGELKSMHALGASCAELHRWLKKKRIHVSRSTVYRYLNRG